MKTENSKLWRGLERSGDWLVAFALGYLTLSDWSDKRATVIAFVALGAGILLALAVGFLGPKATKPDHSAQT